MPFLSLIISNWKTILSGTIFLVWSYAIYSQGEARIQTKWDAATIEAQKEAQVAHDRLQAVADKASKEYEDSAAKQKLAIATLNRRLKNEISTNAVLRSCVADDIWLQIYNSAAGIGNSTP